MTKKPTNLSKLSLAATLGLASCAHVDVPARPFYMQGNLDSLLAQPVDTVARPAPQAAKDRSLNDSSYTSRSLVNTNPSYSFNGSTSSEGNLEQPSETNLMNYGLQLPTQFTARDTYLDAGLVQLAVGDDTLKVRPIYSPSYDISLRHPLRIERSQDHETRPYGDFKFQNDNLMNLPVDDPERMRHDQSVAINALARWVWSCSALQPLRVVADDVRCYSNNAVRSVFGSHSELDFSSGRLALDFTGIKTDYFDVELSPWIDIGDTDNIGLVLQISFHGRPQYVFPWNY